MVMWTGSPYRLPSAGICSAPGRCTVSLQTTVPSARRAVIVNGNASSGTPWKLTSSGMVPGVHQRLGDALQVGREVIDQVRAGRVLGGAVAVAQHNGRPAHCGLRAGVGVALADPSEPDAARAVVLV